MLFKRKKRDFATEERLRVIEAELVALRGELEALGASVSVRREERASLSKTVNEWVWGEEAARESGSI